MIGNCGDHTRRSPKLAGAPTPTYRQPVTTPTPPFDLTGVHLELKRVDSTSRCSHASPTHDDTPSGPDASDTTWLTEEMSIKLANYLIERRRQNREARMAGVPKTTAEVRQILTDVNHTHEKLRTRLLQHGVDIDRLREGPYVTGCPLGRWVIEILPDVDATVPFCVCIASRISGNIATVDVDQELVAQACDVCRSRFKSLAVLRAGNRPSRNTDFDVVCLRQHRLARVLRLGGDVVVLGAGYRDRQETLYWTNGAAASRMQGLTYGCRCGVAAVPAENIDAWLRSGRRRVPWPTIDQIGQQLRGQEKLNKAFDEYDVDEFCSIFIELLAKSGLSEDQLTRIEQAMRAEFAPYTWTAGPPRRE
jgi:hypothetical protein